MCIYKENLATANLDINLSFNFYAIIISIIVVKEIHVLFVHFKIISTVTILF